MSFGSILLSVLAPNLKSISGFQTVHYRYQVISVIYANFTIICGLALWIIINGILNNKIYNFAFVFSLLLNAASLWSLRINKTNYAVMMLFLSTQWTSFIMGFLFQYSLGTIFLIGVVSTVTVSLPGSMKVHLLNSVAHFIQVALHIVVINKRFELTVDESQTNDIFQFQLLVPLGLILVLTLAYRQKLSREAIWSTAKKDYEMMEEISKETVQAATSKDLFVSSLSHEIRNPLNSMNGSIDYLIRVTSDPAHLQILHSAKLSGDVLLNLLTNVLDAAKLKTDKIELSFCETDPIDIVKKVSTIHSGKLQDKNIQTETFISKNLPTVLWIDHSRLFANNDKFVFERI